MKWEITLNSNASIPFKLFNDSSLIDSNRAWVYTDCIVGSAPSTEGYCISHPVNPVGYLCHWLVYRRLKNAITFIPVVKFAARLLEITCNCNRWERITHCPTHLLVLPSGIFQSLIFSSNVAIMSLALLSGVSWYISSPSLRSLSLVSSSSLSEVQAMLAKTFSFAVWPRTSSFVCNMDLKCGKHLDQPGCIRCGNKCPQPRITILLTVGQIAFSMMKNVL